MAKKWVAAGPGGIDELEYVDAEVPAPGPGEVTVTVRAAGVNPADYKHLSRASSFPVGIGYEVAGVITTVGDDAVLGSGEAATVGTEVIGFRVAGGYATAITIPAADVFRKPEALSFPEAANLLLAGTTAAEMLDVTKVTASETVLIHAASGAVGVSALQQAHRAGARVIGTGSPSSFDRIRSFGGEPVAYGPGLEERVRDLAPEGVDAVLDAVGTEEAVSVSMAVLRDRARAVTIVRNSATDAAGMTPIGSAMPASKAFRDAVRGTLVAAAAAGELVVPLASTYPLTDAPDALRLLRRGHPGGKIALVP